jgi:hypothetical protein
MPSLLDAVERACELIYDVSGVGFKCQMLI